MIFDNPQVKKKTPIRNGMSEKNRFPEDVHFLSNINEIISKAITLELETVTNKRSTTLNHEHRSGVVFLNLYAEAVQIGKKNNDIFIKSFFFLLFFKNNGVF